MAQYVLPTSPHVSSDTPRERIAKAIVYVARIFDVISPKYGKAKQAVLASERIKFYEETHPRYMNSIAYLVENIKASEASVGALDDLIATSDQDGWKEFLKSYGDRGSPLGAGKEGRMGGDAVVHMA
jgi:hypothetical protein